MAEYDSSRQAGTQTDAMIVSKAGLKEAIISVLLEHLSEEWSGSLSEREAQRIAEDIVWRGTTMRDRFTSKP